LRLLVLGHVSAAEHALDAVFERWPGASVDLLIYGRGAAGFRAYKDARVVALPESGGARRMAWSAIRMLGRPYRPRYHTVVIAQPDLDRSQARGALRNFAVLSGARQALTLDPESGRVVPLRRSSAVLDGLAWLLLQAVVSGATSLATLILERAARIPPPPPQTLPAGGPALYLRTDLELASTPLKAGGSAAHTEGIVRALIRRGYPTTVATTGRIAGMPADTTEARLPALVAPNVPTETLEWLSGLWQASAVLRAGSSSSLVYQRYSLNNLAGLIIARRRGVPLVLEANASEVLWRQQWSRLRFPRFAAACERLLLSQADRIATVSDNAATQLLSAGADTTRVRVIPNAVEFERFATAAPVALPFPPRSFVVAFAGLFYPWQGVPTLASAFALLARGRRDTRLLLVGDGSSGPEVRGILNRAGVADRVHLAGVVAREAVPGYLAAADVLVSPHTGVQGFIGSPVKLFEYMASGRAIIATRVAQLEQILEHERTALLVAPDDPEALCDAMIRLRDEPALSHALGTAAATEARDRHTWDARLAALVG
jgi:glycosyltransferase involved in cell wall biosynthesis